MKPDHLREILILKVTANGITGIGFEFLRRLAFGQNRLTQRTSGISAFVRFYYEEDDSVGPAGVTQGALAPQQFPVGVADVTVVLTE